MKWYEKSMAFALLSTHCLTITRESSSLIIHLPLTNCLSREAATVNMDKYGRQSRTFFIAKIGIISIFAKLLSSFLRIC